MPLTSKQIDRIMRKAGKAYVSRDHLNYAGRVCETYARKKIYRWEDRAALAGYRLLKVAQADIREYAHYAAAQLQLSEVGSDAKSITFRRMLNGYMTQRLGQFANDIAAQAYQYAVTGYAAGWYLRQWQIQQALHKPEAFRPQRLQTHRASARVLQPSLTEAVRPDSALYDYAGAEWRDTYTNVTAAAIVKVKSAVNRTLTKPASVGQVTQDIAATLGTDNENPKGLYHSTQLMTRSAIIRSFSHSSVDAYQTHVEWLVGAMWITSNDDRVCPICRPQNGRIFIINDLVGIALFGLPPDGTHYGCRCAIIPLLIPVDKANEPPEDSFDEWLDDWNFYDDIDVFMSDTQLASTQV